MENNNSIKFYVDVERVVICFGYADFRYAPIGYADLPMDDSNCTFTVVNNNICYIQENGKGVVICFGYADLPMVDSNCIFTVVNNNKPDWYKQVC